MSIFLYQGDSRDVLRNMPANSIDSVVTDPPYALVSVVKRFGGANAAAAKDTTFGRMSKGFMGKTWDTGEVAHDPNFWREVYRVLKPGGHVLAFGGTRTVHRLTCAVEDAGFEVRDMIAWLYGSGFPKSHNILEKTKEKYECLLRENVNLAAQKLRRFQVVLPEGKIGFAVVSAETPQEDDAGLKTVIGVVVDSQDQTDMSLFVSTEHIDWNTISSLNSKLGDACNPTNKSITLTELKTITGLQIWNLLPYQSTLKSIVILNHTALKPALEPITLARKPLEAKTVAGNVLMHGTGAINVDGCRVGTEEDTSRVLQDIRGGNFAGGNGAGRLDRIGGGHSGGRFPANVIHDGSDEVVSAFPDRKGATSNSRSGVGGIAAEGLGPMKQTPGRGDDGSAARFFYSAKANKTDRAGSKHPTVKPIALMQYLCRLITPPGGTVLDPFAGSGTTGAAAQAEGFDCVLIEREAEYVADISKRLKVPTIRLKAAANDNNKPLPQQIDLEEAIAQAA